MSDDYDSSATEVRLQNMRAMLRILEAHIERGYKDFDTLDNKARANIAAASLLLSFVTSFQLLGPGNAVPPIYWLILITILALYSLMIIISIRVVLPEDYRWPVPADWKVVTDYWDFETEEAYLAQITSDTIAAIEHNQLTTNRKVYNLKTSSTLFGMIVAGLVVMALIRLATS
jgi:hypothetical protein